MKNQNRFFSLPQLEFGYDELWPYITEEQLRIHHQKHHSGYVNKANNLIRKIDKARENSQEIKLRHLLNDLSFNMGGHLLHSLFWENLHPAADEKTLPKKLKQKLEKEFESVENFKAEFEQAANSIQGSGWVGLVYQPETDRLLINEIQQHHRNIAPGLEILMVLDLWEHAYYIDYRNEKHRFVKGFWEIVDWETIEQRLNQATK